MRKCKVRFALEKGVLDTGTPWPPCEAESLWGELIAPRAARLLNSPFFARGVSYLDEVVVRNAELPSGMSPEDAGPNFFEFESVLNRSGHGTVRAILTSEATRELAEIAVSKIERLGCTWESAAEWRPTLSIDIPPEVDQREVMAILEAAHRGKAIHIDVGFLPAREL
jgi:hypothetical protein